MKTTRFSLTITPQRSRNYNSRSVSAPLEKLLKMANKAAKSRRAMFVHILKSRGYDKPETVFFCKNKLRPMTTRTIRLALIALVLGLALSTCTGCCRPATEFQMMKWERRHKFESPRQFWGLHIFRKQTYRVKYEKRRH